MYIQTIKLTSFIYYCLFEECLQTSEVVYPQKYFENRNYLQNKQIENEENMSEHTFLKTILITFGFLCLAYITIHYMDHIPFDSYSILSKKIEPHTLESIAELAKSIQRNEKMEFWRAARHIGYGGPYHIQIALWPEIKQTTTNVISGNVLR